MSFWPAPGPIASGLGTSGCCLTASVRRQQGLRGQPAAHAGTADCLLALRSSTRSGPPPPIGPGNPPRVSSSSPMGSNPWASRYSSLSCAGRGGYLSPGRACGGCRSCSSLRSRLHSPQRLCMAVSRSMLNPTFRSSLVRTRSRSCPAIVRSHPLLGPRPPRTQQPLREAP
jgi:hypothetical protein